MNAAGLVPGVWVRLSARPEWGRGQIQSVIDGRITVNFEHAGKQLLLADMVTLDIVQILDKD